MFITRPNLEPLKPDTLDVAIQDFVESRRGSKSPMQSRQGSKQSVGPPPMKLEKKSNVGVEVIFESNGEEHPVTFTHKPLGMSFTQGLPLSVKNVSNEALRLGVQAGWVVKSFDGFNISTSGMTYVQVTQLMKQCTEGLPTSDSFKEGIKIAFELNGEQREVSFRQKPLGMTFMSQLPLTVKTSNHLAVGEGWMVTSINDLNISQSAMGYDQVVQHLRALVQGLPLNVDFQELKIVFESNGEQHPVSFKQKPLGLKFRPGLNPPVVESVFGHAQQLGVKEGWTVTQVNGVDVSLAGLSENLIPFLYHYMDHLEDVNKVAGG